MSLDIVILCIAAFGAGFIDSIVGGGGFLQIPALMMVHPTAPVVSLLATNKVVSIVGTATAAFRFSRSIKPSKQVVFFAVPVAFFAALLGAYSVTIINNNALKPICLVLMILAFVFLLRNKSFGLGNSDYVEKHSLWKPLVLGASLGFYDGFFGAGVGSFLIIGLVTLMSMNLVHASANAKIVNVATNAAAILLFSFKTNIMWSVAMPMVFFNLLGSIVGVRFAVLKGNTFVQVLLRSILGLTILKFAYDVFSTMLNR